MSRPPVTLREIARRTGVHESTVSRALNDRTRHLVAKDVAARIAGTARELGYRPNIMAAALRTRRSMSVGVLAERLDEPALAPLLAGIEEALCDAGYAMMVAATGNDDTRFAAALDSLEAHAADGVVVAGTMTADIALSVPLVTPGDIPDSDEPGIGLAVEHLVRRGHRTIGHLAGPTGDSAARTRLAGFRMAMTAAGLFVSAVETCDALTVEAGRQGAEALLARRPNLTALVAADDRLAIGALDALAEHGRKCPHDVSVTGFGDLPLADHSYPPLTTVFADHRAAGRQLAALLLTRIGGDEAAPATPVHIELRERGTTASARPPAPPPQPSEKDET